MANLVTIFTNGTFEVPAAPGTGLTIDNTIARTGVQSGKFTFNNVLGNPYIMETFSFPAQVGKIYKFDAWIKTDSDNSSGKCSFILVPSITTDVLIDFTTTQFRTADADWRKISVTYKCTNLSGGNSLVDFVVVNGATYNVFKADATNMGTIVNSLSMVGTETYVNGATLNVDDLFADISTLPQDPQFTGEKLYYTKSVFMLSDGNNLFNIEEPIGWDKIQLALTFDKEVKGFKFEFTDKDVELQFDDPAGRVMINDFYDGAVNGKGTEAYMGLKYGRVDPTTQTLEILFEGRLNFDGIQKKKYVTVLTAQRESMAINFANLYSSVFTLEQQTTLTKGIAIADLTKYLVYLHSRELTQTISGAYNENVNVNDPVPQNPEPNIPFGISNVPPFHFTQNDLSDFQEPIEPDGELIYSGLNLPAGVSERRFTINAFCKFQFDKGNTGQFVQAGLVVYKKSNISGGTNADVPIEVVSGTYALAGFQTYSINAGTYIYDFGVSGEISLKADEALFIKIVFTSLGAFAITNMKYLDTTGPSWRFFTADISLIEPSTFQGYRPFDVLDRMFTMVTDSPASFKSDFLQNGCGKDHVMGSGKMVRAFPGAQSQVNWKDMFTSWDMLYNMGLTFEWDPITGKERGRMEPMEFFFQDVELIKLNTIVDYVKSPNSELIFNELEFGFNKSPQSDEPGSVDEFLTQINILTPIRQVTQKLSKKCALVLSSVFIEKARRESYQFNSTGQQDNDNDNFMIATQPVAISTINANGVFSAADGTLICDKIIPVIDGDEITISGSAHNDGTYKVNHVFVDYEAFPETTTLTFKTNPALTDETIAIDIDFSERLIPKRTEEYQALSVTGINNPNSIYNLQHQLARVVRSWAKYFISGFSWILKGDPFLNPAQLRFNAMIANDKLGTEMNQDVVCRNFFDFGNTDFPTTVNDKGPYLISAMDLPLFTYNKINFKAPMTWSTWNIIRKALEGRHPDGKNYGYFSILNPDGIYEKGWLNNGTFDPNTQIATLELREKFNG